MSPLLPDLEIAWMAGKHAPRRLDQELLPLLAAIRATGKLTTAANRLGIPYRRAWQAIQSWEDELGASLVRKERGRGTRLTPLGEKLLLLQARVEALLHPHLQRAASEVSQELQGFLGGEQAPLAMVASHDLALKKLTDHLNGDRGPGVTVRFAGSLNGLMALGRGECDLAGFHLPEGELARPIRPTFRPWLDPGNHRLVRLVARRQGLIVAPGNPMELASVADIARTGARFINRQAGSGTRLAMDELVSAAGLDGRRIPGYQAEEYTHLAVAAAVAGGLADVGLGEESAARMLELGFVPLYREVYYLALTESLLAAEPVSRLLEVLRGSDFQALIAPLGGYDGEGAGTVVDVETVLPAGE
jgi:molybdate transport repressor ModE-like protein